MGGRIDVLGLEGSLRKGSYNKSLLRAAAELDRSIEATNDITAIIVFKLGPAVF